MNTVIWHFDGITGRDVRVGSDKSDKGVIEGFEIIDGPLVGIYLMEQEGGYVIMLDEFLRVRSCQLFHLA